MSNVQALMENESVKQFLNANEDLLAEATAVVESFPKVLKGFVLSHPAEFLAENLEETYKNIRVFTEVATAQFITEITTIYGSSATQRDVVAESSVNDYI